MEHEPTENGSRAPLPKTLEIDTGQARRWRGGAAYVLLFLVLSIALFVLLYQFTTSLALAWGLVAFMIGYMLLMGWLAARNENQSRR